MVDFHTIELDNVGMAEFLEQGDLMDDGFNSTCVLLLDGELGREEEGGMKGRNEREEGGRGGGRGGGKEREREEEERGEKEWREGSREEKGGGRMGRRREEAGWGGEVGEDGSFHS